MSTADLRAACGNCGHPVGLHGRRGHGSCRNMELTEHGRKEIEALKERIETKDPVVRKMVLEVALALPGITERCGCKRFRKRRAAAGGAA